MIVYLSLVDKDFKNRIELNYYYGYIRHLCKNTPLGNFYFSVFAAGNFFPIFIAISFRENGNF